MLSLRDHGGNYGGGTKLNLGYGKVVKQIAKIPLSMSSQGGGTLAFAQETQNYLWWVFLSGSYYYICRQRKNDPSDIKIFEQSNSPQCTGILPLYDLDKIIYLNATATMTIFSADMTKVTLAGNVSTNYLCGYYWDKNSKIMYLSYGAANTFYMRAMNFTNPATPTLIYDVTVAGASGTSGVWVLFGFEPENNAVRILSADPNNYYNQRRTITTSTVIASYGSTNSGFNMANQGFKAVYGADYNTMFFADGSGNLNKWNLTTNTLITSKTLASLQSDIQAKLPFTVSSWGGTLKQLRKLKNGQYAGWMGINRISSPAGNTNPPTGYVHFVFDDNMVIQSVMTDWASNLGVTSQRRDQLNELEYFSIQNASSLNADIIFYN